MEKGDSPIKSMIDICKIIANFSSEMHVLLHYDFPHSLKDLFFINKFYIVFFCSVLSQPRWCFHMYKFISQWSDDPKKIFAFICPKVTYKNKQRIKVMKPPKNREQKSNFTLFKLNLKKAPSTDTKSIRLGYFFSYI